MIESIDTRRSIRKYKSMTIEKSIIDEIIYSATLAPSEIHYLLEQQLKT